ncbi:MAG TPA: COX15/CtaA family protein [Gaiellaceae bacterium]|nr:COX15/CtaA family protein [Gaiellaceae bacterium]
MHVESAPGALGRSRSLTLSPQAFRWVAMGAVTTLVLIVASGATVRLTGSGLGCPPVTVDIAACVKAYGARGYHSDIEFFNRVVSGLTVIVALVLAVAAWRTRGLGRRAKLLATGAFLGTFAQAPLGALTVHYHLNPYLVISHLLVALVALGLGVLVLLEATRVVHGGGSALPALARWGGATLLAAVSVLVVSGTLSTAAGRFPGSSGSQVVERIWIFHSAVYWHVRAVAVFGVVFLALAGWAWRRRDRLAWLVRGCAGLLAILLAQMGIGELQYRTYGTVPWGVVVLHVAIAALLFAWTVGLVARLWRPVAHEDVD